MAVAMPGKRRRGRREYAQISFCELDEDSSRIASSLQGMGVPIGARIVLLVRPSIDFISLVFAMLKAGLTIVLIDPGMGRRRMLACLQELEPEGFIAIPMAQAVRALLTRRFPSAKFNVTVGARWFWGGPTLKELRQRGDPNFTHAETFDLDPAAIIFTTGSTGPPKGVLYRHLNFDRQVEELRDQYGIEAGEIDLPGFPLFGLFNCAMGVSTVIPDMDPTKPAQVNPENIVEAIQDWNVTQAFGSPALWNVVGQHCEKQGTRLDSLRRVLSAGAPVPPHVLQRMRDAINKDGDIHTPYGATEALPIATIAGSTVLKETADLTREGRGVCVGERFPGAEWKVIKISDEPIEQIQQVEDVAAGEIGELMVRGDVVTSEYVTRLEANSHHKVNDGDTIWHRMGDVGYLEPAANGRAERFWFCGRKSHRVITRDGPMYTTPCEAIINTHPDVYRSALVGVGERPCQRPLVWVETWPEKRPRTKTAREKLVNELLELAASHELTRPIRDVLLHRSLPVDIRHNAKIFREQLAEEAAKSLRESA